MAEKYQPSAPSPVDAAGVRWGRSARLDLCAVGISTLCVLHCVALPVLAALMPVAAQAAESELVHKVLVAAAVPVSLRVIWKTRLMAGNRWFAGAVLLGIGLLLSAAFIEAASAHEQPLTIAGASLVGLAHLWRYVRQCKNG